MGTRWPLSRGKSLRRQHVHGLTQYETNTYLNTLTSAFGANTHFNHHRLSIYNNNMIVSIIEQFICSFQLVDPKYNRYWKHYISAHSSCYLLFIRRKIMSNIIFGGSRWTVVSVFMYTYTARIEYYYIINVVNPWGHDIVGIMVVHVYVSAVPLYNRIRCYNIQGDLSIVHTLLFSSTIQLFKIWFLEFLNIL